MATLIELLEDFSVIDGRKRPLSAEHRAKLSAAQKGKKRGPMNIRVEKELERRRKISETLRGRPLSNEHKAKLKQWHAGKTLSVEHKLKIGIAIKGRVVSAETRRKVSVANRGQKPTQFGEKHHFWKGGITSENRKVRSSKDSQRWRSQVFERDDYTCQKCQIRGSHLHAHHIKQFSQYPDLRFDLSNGLTVCVPCHRAIHRLEKEAA